MKLTRSNYNRADYKVSQTKQGNIKIGLTFIRSWYELNVTVCELRINIKALIKVWFRTKKKKKNYWKMYQASKIFLLLHSKTIKFTESLRKVSIRWVLVCFWKKSIFLQSWLKITVLEVFITMRKNVKKKIHYYWYQIYQ